MKEHFARVKAELSVRGIHTVSTTTIMQELGVQYRAEKEDFTNGATDKAAANRVEVDLTEDRGIEGDEVDELYREFTALVL